MAFIKPREFGGKIIRKKESSSSSSLPSPPSYVRLSRGCDSHDKDDEQGETITPKGHVPVMVGVNEEGPWKRYVVPTWFMKDPSMAVLLRLSAHEFGYNCQGVLQIPCEPQQFEKIISKLSKKKGR